MGTEQPTGAPLSASIGTAGREREMRAFVSERGGRFASRAKGSRLACSGGGPPRRPGGPAATPTQCGARCREDADRPFFHGLTERLTHEVAPALEQVSAPVGCLDDLAGMIGLFGCPLPEARPEAVPYGGDLLFLQEPARRFFDSGFARRLENTNGLWPSNPRARSRISRARRHSGRQRVVPVWVALRPIRVHPSTQVYNSRFDPLPGASQVVGATIVCGAPASILRALLRIVS